MLSRNRRAVLITAVACTLALLLAVTPLRSQSDVQSFDVVALRQKAAAGNAEAQAELGFRYLYGSGVTQHYPQARIWCQKAADQGNASGETSLGEIYQYGMGVTADFAQARAWYQKAADQGDSRAESRLGLMYEQGLGMKQDIGQARSWYQKAADQGSDFARKRLAALTQNTTNSTGAPSCDPNWSPRFSQITFGGFDNSPASVRQITEQQIAKYGGVDQSIAQVESEKASYQQQLVQQQTDGNADGVNQLQQMILFSDGMLDILRCRQQISRQQSAESSGPSQGSPAGSARSATSPPVRTQIDVRYFQVESRPLTDAEMTELRNSIRWNPESVPLAPGGTARSNLVDDKGRSLGAVLVRWEKPTTPKTMQTSSQARDHITIQVENTTSCVFQSSAELDDSQGFVVVSGVTWSGWLTLHQPGPGQTSQIKGDATLSQAYPALALRPLTPYSTLSACMTPIGPGAGGGSVTTSSVQGVQGQSSASAPQTTRSPNSGPNNLVGTWTHKDDVGSMTYVFSADGSVSLSSRRNSDGASGGSFRGRWSLSGDSLTLVNLENQQTARISIQFLDAMHLQWTIPGHESVIWDRLSKN